MFLEQVETGHSGEAKARLERIQSVVGHVDGIDRALAYRPELWGDAHRAANERVCRGPSYWTFGERELMATFVAAQNNCPFCTGFHEEVASIELGREVVDAVLADLDTAPVRDELRETLRFLRKLTLEPRSVTADDVRPLLELGLSERTINDAIHVCALFNLIDRVADGLGIEALPQDLAHKGARFVAGTGY